jgi:hypothetical protein
MGCRLLGRIIIGIIDSRRRRRKYRSLISQTADTLWSFAEESSNAQSIYLYSYETTDHRDL